MIEVTPRARRREDRAGDPLDGLVNLLAALSSLHLSGAITRNGLRAGSSTAIVIAPGQKVAPLPTPGGRTIGRGTQVGIVYRLADGRLVYVQAASRSKPGK